MAREKKERMVTGGEKLSYGLYFVGQNIFYIMLTLFLVTYFTDIGMPAATVGVITLIVKVWDAINDPIFGGLVDKIKFKKGKFVPWLRLSLLAIPLATIFLFAIPSDVSDTVKIVWSTIGYMLWDLAYTICDVPIFGLVTTMTNKQNERTSLMSIGRVAAMLAAVVVMVIVPQIREAIGGWMPTTILLSVIAVIVMAPICFTAKERVKPQGGDEDQEMGLKQMFTFIGKNKYMLIYFGALLLYGASNISQTLGMYIARYLLGDEGLMSLTSLVGLIPAIIIGMFIPLLTRKVDKFYVYMAALGFTVVMNVIAYFVGYQNFGAYMVMMFLRSVPLGAITMLMFMFTPDCAEYGFYKSGVAAPGISFSVQTFTAKANSALATSLGAFALGLIGFVAGEGAVQPAGFNEKLWFMSVLLPSIGCVLSMLVLSRYKLRDKHVEVMARFNSGEISREEADAALAGQI